MNGSTVLDQSEHSSREISAGRVIVLVVFETDAVFLAGVHLPGVVMVRRLLTLDAVVEEVATASLPVDASLRVIAQAGARCMRMVR